MENEHLAKLLEGEKMHIIVLVLLLPVAATDSTKSPVDLLVRN